MTTILPAYPGLARIFPDFDLATLPDIPDGFEDDTVENEGCPIFIHHGLGLELVVAYPDPEMREGDQARYVLSALTPTVSDGWQTLGSTVLAASEDWNDILATLTVFSDAARLGGAS